MLVESGHTYQDERLGGATFPEELTATRFIRCDLRGADLREVVTQGVVFDACDFSGAQLNASSHHASGFLNCRMRGVSLFDASFQACKMLGSDFTECRWALRLIEGGDWSYTTLRYAGLSGLRLDRVKWVEADLMGADLRGSTFRDGDLSRAVLTKALLGGADLRGARLDGIRTVTVDWSEVRVDVAQAILLAEGLGAVVE